MSVVKSDIWIMWKFQFLKLGLLTSSFRYSEQTCWTIEAAARKNRPYFDQTRTVRRTFQDLFVTSKNLKSVIILKPCTL